jgi:hypothetical protein
VRRAVPRRIERGRAPQPSRSIRIHRNARCEPKRCAAASPFLYRRPDCAAASKSSIRAGFRPTRSKRPQACRAATVGQRRWPWRTCRGSMPSSAAPSRSRAMGGAVARAKATATHPQGNQGIKEAVGELDAARCDDQRPDLRAHRPARSHRPSALSRPIRGFTPAEPIHAIRIRLPVEAVQGYRQGDGRDKSCQQLSCSGIILVPTTGREKNPGSRPVPFLKTAPIINWPVCPW